MLHHYTELHNDKKNVVVPDNRGNADRDLQQFTSLLWEFTPLSVNHILWCLQTGLWKYKRSLYIHRDYISIYRVAVKVKSVLCQNLLKPRRFLSAIYFL